MSSFQNVLSPSDLEYINNLPEVLSAKNKLSTSNKVYFSLSLNDTIRSTILERLGLDLSNVESIPMRWIKGDTAPHVDRGASQFEKTYLLYVNEGAGEFILDSVSYPIIQNTAFVFDEGLSHETLHTGTEPRLLIGPMNELAQPVGVATIYYYLSEADILNNVTAYASYQYNVSSSYNITTENGISRWLVSSLNGGSLPIETTPGDYNVVYTTGRSLIMQNYSIYFYPAPSPAPVLCFKEDSKILCLKDDKEVEVKIQDLRPATLVKTVNNGYMKVTVVSKSILNNPAGSERVKDKLYKCSKEKYPELSEDLYITGCHSILVNTLSLEQQEKIKATFGRLYITSNKYRLMAMIDERAEPCIEPGEVAIYHFALDNDEICYNYGVYANGLLVESCNTKDIMSRKDVILL